MLGGAGLGWVVVAAGAVVADQRARARGDELVAIGGTLAPLDGPATELWSSDVSLVPRAPMVAGRLIGVDSRANGRADVVGPGPTTTDCSRTNVRPGGCSGAPPRARRPGRGS